MTAKELRRLKELEETVNSLARMVSGLVDHQLHLSPYRCPYCNPAPLIPFTPWPHFTTTWIGTTAPSYGYQLPSEHPTVTSGYIETNV